MLATNPQLLFRHALRIGVGFVLLGFALGGNAQNSEKGPPSLSQQASSPPISSDQMDSSTLPDEGSRKEERGKGERRSWKKLAPEEKEQLQEFRRQAPHMSPEERRQAIAKLPRFKDMPPEERGKAVEKFAGNYERWQQMSSAERKEARQRWKQKKSGTSSEASTPKSPDSRRRRKQ